MSKTAVVACMVVGLSIASAHKGPKTYEVKIPESAMIGNTQLQPGEYRLRVDGSKAFFLKENSSTTIEAAVKVENVERKFRETSFEFTKISNGGEKLTEIRLGGSRMKLEFSN